MTYLGDHDQATWLIGRSQNLSQQPGLKNTGAFSWRGVKINMSDPIHVRASCLLQCAFDLLSQVYPSQASICLRAHPIFTQKRNYRGATKATWPCSSPTSIPNLSHSLIVPWAMRLRWFCQASNHNPDSSHVVPPPTNARQFIWAPKPVLWGNTLLIWKQKINMPIERHLVGNPKLH